MAIKIYFTKGEELLSRYIITFMKFIKNHRFKEVLIIYIIMNLGFLLTIYGSILYHPAMIPDSDDMNPESTRMELMNNTKGAFIAQDFDLPRYNIGFDMLNVGGIFLLVGTLMYNYIEQSTLSHKKGKPGKQEYSLREKGIFKGNIIEWLCVIVFFFAFFTFFNSIFFYIVILSFILGILGFTFRKLRMYNSINHITLSNLIYKH